MDATTRDAIVKTSMTASKPASPFNQKIPDFPRCIAGDQFALVHHENLVRHRKQFFQTVLGNNDRRAQLTVDTIDNLEEFTCRDRIEL